MTDICNALGALWDAPDDVPTIEQDGRWVTWGAVRRLAELLDAKLSAPGGAPVTGSYS